MSNEENEAFEWWNANTLEIPSRINRSTEISPIPPPECILPKKAFLNWSHICPYFQYINTNYDDIQKYWESISKNLSFFLPNQQIPNPISQFPQFILKLYSIRDILLPHSVPTCLKFLELYQNSIPPIVISQFNNLKSHSKSKSIKSPNTQAVIPQKNTFPLPSGFCLYNIPLYFIDPNLYFRTLNELFYSNHFLWKHFISNAKIIDAFFEMHINFISPILAESGREFWDQRLNLTEILFQLTNHIFTNNNSATILKNHPKAYVYTCKFIECTNKLACKASYCDSIRFFRYLIRVIKLAQNKIPSDQLKPLCIQFLNGFDRCQSSLFSLAVQFLLKLKLQIVPHSRIIRLILNRGIRELTDIEIISKLCEGNNIMSSLMLLCRLSITSKLWHRACFNEIITIVTKYSERNDVKEWFQNFVRRLFIFVSIASSRLKYRTRTLFIVESLSNLMTIRLLWLQQTVLVAATSIWSSKLVPPYFRSFFPVNSQPDDLLIHELEVFIGNNVTLKTFPFDPNRGTLLLPFADLHKTQKALMSHRSHNNINAHFNFNPPPNLPFASNPYRTNTRNDNKLSSRSEATKSSMKITIQRKKPEPLIKKPKSTKQARNLISAFGITPLHRI